MTEEKVRDREHHERLFKASMNPLRRKMVAAIGVFGKTRGDLKNELKLTDFQLKFNLDWLIKEGFVVEDNGQLKLTDDGVELLEAG
jgi:predicted transcriptional regulator